MHPRPQVILVQVVLENPLKSIDLRDEKPSVAVPCENLEKADSNLCVLKTKVVRITEKQQIILWNKQVLVP